MVHRVFQSFKLVSLLLARGALLDLYTVSTLPSRMHKYRARLILSVRRLNWLWLNCATISENDPVGTEGIVVFELCHVISHSNTTCQLFFCHAFCPWMNDSRLLAVGRNRHCEELEDFLKMSPKFSEAVQKLSAILKFKTQELPQFENLPWKLIETDLKFVVVHYIQAI